MGVKRRVGGRGLPPCRPAARLRFGDANGVIHNSLRATPQATGHQATPSERCKRDSYLVAGGCFDVRSRAAPVYLTEDTEFTEKDLERVGPTDDNSLKQLDGLFELSWSIRYGQTVAH